MTSDKYLALVGTVHTDMQGPRRLEGILKRVSPDIIALELNKDAEYLMNNLIGNKLTPVEEERKMDEYLKEAGLTLNSEQRKTLLESGRKLSSFAGYEFTTSKKYIKEQPKTQLEYIDVSFFENGKQEFIDGITSSMKESINGISKDKKFRKAFLKMLSKGKDSYLQTLQEVADMTYNNKEAIEQMSEILGDPQTFEEYKKQLPSNAVDALEKIYSPQRDEFMANKIRELYSNGSRNVAAITGLYHMPGLKSRLKDLNPIQITLLDYDDYISKIKK